MRRQPPHFASIQEPYSRLVNVPGFIVRPISISHHCRRTNTSHNTKTEYASAVSETATEMETSTNRRRRERLTRRRRYGRTAAGADDVGMGLARLCLRTDKTRRGGRRTLGPAGQPRQFTRRGVDDQQVQVRRVGFRETKVPMPRSRFLFELRAFELRMREPFPGKLLGGVLFYLPVGYRIGQQYQRGKTRGTKHRPP